MTEPLVKASGLSWRYTIGGWVLNDLDLVIHPGEKVGWVGRSGSGKSTLALAIRGIIPQSCAGGMRGQVVVCGRDTATTPVPDLAQSVAMVFQSPDDQMSQILVRHEVASGPANQRLPIEIVRRRTKEALEIMRIGHLAERETNTLSGGEKQKVAIAAALAMKGQLLILDEPTTDLDPRAKQEIVQVLKALDDETAIVVISHDIDILSPLVERLVILEEGTVVADCTRDSIFKRPELLKKHGVTVPQVVAFNHLMRARDQTWPITADIDSTSALLRQFELGELQQNSRRSSLDEQEVVVLEGVSFRYPESEELALRDISFSLRRGEMVALVGNNGAGKSTLGMLLLGLLKPTSGRIEVLGEEVCGIQPQKTGYIFQNPDAMFCCMSVRDEIAFTPKTLGIPGWRQMTEDSLIKLNLEKLAGRFPLALSKGQRQQVAYASVAISQPPILIFDEPTTGIDRPSCERIMAYMDHLRREGKTILFITHDMILASEWADRIMVLNDGELVFDSTPRELLATGRKRLGDLHLTLPAISELASEIGLTAGVLTPEELFATVGGAK